jgi:hypothetical protein
MEACHEIFSQPIYWKTKQGKWVDIDNTIVPSMENLSFPFKNASNDLHIWFAEKTTNQAINRIQKNEQYVEFVPQQAQTTVGIPSGNKITYSNIYPSVDISYTVLASGVKEDIILLDPSAQHTYTFGI